MNWQHKMYRALVVMVGGDTAAALSKCAKERCRDFYTGQSKKKIEINEWIRQNGRFAHSFHALDTILVCICFWGGVKSTALNT